MLLARDDACVMRKLFTFKNKRHMPKWLAVALSYLLRVVGWTYRVTIEDPAGVLDAVLSGERFVLAMWHNRILFAPVLVPRRHLEHVAVLISASRDGEYIATIARQFGLQVVRGSSSRGALGALLGLRQKLDAGDSVLLTVDGPRGPRYCVHPGAAALSLHCGAPLVPMSINARHCWHAASWDRLQIPWPFTRVTVRFGRPLALPRGCSAEAGSEMLRQAMLEISRIPDGAKPPPSHPAGPGVIGGEGG